LLPAYPWRPPAPDNGTDPAPPALSAVAYDGARRTWQAGFLTFRTTINIDSGRHPLLDPLNDW